LTKSITPQDAFVILGDVDEEFKELYARFEKLLPYIDNQTSLKEAITDEVLNEIGDFLSSQTYPAKTTEMFEGELVKKVKSVPSLSVEILLTFINSFGKLLPQHFGHIAAEWEEENSKYFVSVQGFYMKPEYIIDKENLSVYHYPFLEMRGFKKLDFIFLKDGKDAGKALEDEFINLLNKGRENTNLKPFKDAKKIEIHTVNKLSEPLKKLISHPINTGEYLHAFWVFTTSSGSKIAFVGINQKGEVNIVYNLPYSVAIERSNQFDRIWETLSIKG
jgi:hypothetical protein